MAQLKTRPTEQSVDAFLASVPDEGRRRDGLALRDLMAEVTGCEAKLWGPSIVGFGDYHYRYASGHEGDTFLIGFSPRKSALTLYFVAEPERREEALSRLGKHKTGKGCLYITRLADVDTAVLRALLSESVRHQTNAPEPT